MGALNRNIFQARKLKLRYMCRISRFIKKINEITKQKIEVLKLFKTRKNKCSTLDIFDIRKRCRSSRLYC